MPHELLSVQCCALLAGVPEQSQVNIGGLNGPTTYMNKLVGATRTEIDGHECVPQK
jgi:hypothetical protein